MISLHDWMRERLLNKKGLGAPKPPPKHRLEDLAKSEWSAQFETYMRNRLIMGALRYGLMKDKNKPKYDRIKSIEKRLKQYQDTGNTEFLVDVANLCLLEFEESEHPNRHFAQTNDDHCGIIKGK